ncbi:hypothetical protein C8F04DRAFT_1349172 [Mycena alexandri]|uniref:Uncharacterized protein n=1 Tax=Mycena alexandri TaxID=1745969 RepID=A0AAD6SWR8_9AGAR|nr:hypothetical protein C8F04DRAFT_1349172 [Mycena alexandri]
MTVDGRRYTAERRTRSETEVTLRAGEERESHVSPHSEVQDPATPVDVGTSIDAAPPPRRTRAPAGSESPLPPSPTRAQHPSVPLPLAVRDPQRDKHPMCIPNATRLPLGPVRAPAGSESPSPTRLQHPSADAPCRSRSETRSTAARQAPDVHPQRDTTASRGIGIRSAPRVPCTHARPASDATPLHAPLSAGDAPSPPRTSSHQPPDLSL